SRSRYDFAVQTWLSPDRLARLRKDYAVEIVGFDESTRAMAPAAVYQPAERAAAGEMSNILGSVSTILANAAARGADAPASAVVVLSDGRDNAQVAESPAAVPLFAPLRGIPVHTVSLGGPNLQRDVAVVAVPLQEYLIADEEGLIAVRLIA